MTTIKIEDTTLSDIKRRSLFGRSRWVFCDGMRMIRDEKIGC